MVLITVGPVGPEQKSFRVSETVIQKSAKLYRMFCELKRASKFGIVSDMWLPNDDPVDMGRIFESFYINEEKPRIHVLDTTAPNPWAAVQDLRRLFYLADKYEFWHVRKEILLTMLEVLDEWDCPLDRGELNAMCWEASRQNVWKPGPYEGRTLKQLDKPYKTMPQLVDLSKSETGSQTGSETGSETGSVTGIETKPQITDLNGSQTGSQTVGETGSDTESDIETENEAWSGSETESRTRGWIEFLVNSESESDSESDSEGDSESDSEDDTESESESEDSSETRSESGSETGSKFWSGNESEDLLDREDWKRAKPNIIRLIDPNCVWLHVIDKTETDVKIKIEDEDDKMDLTDIKIEAEVKDDAMDLTDTKINAEAMNDTMDLTKTKDLADTEGPVGTNITGPKVTDKTKVKDKTDVVAGHKVIGKKAIEKTKPKPKNKGTAKTKTMFQTENTSSDEDDRIMVESEDVSSEEENFPVKIEDVSPDYEIESIE